MNEENNNFEDDIKILYIRFKKPLPLWEGMNETLNLNKVEMKYTVL